MSDFAVSNKNVGFQPVKSQLKILNPVDATVSSAPVTVAPDYIGSESEKILLPPPQVLFAWLAYIYETTGEWVMPPTLDNHQSGSISGITALNSSSYVTTTNNQEDDSSRITGSGFDYVNSIYFAEAERLIKTCAKKPVKPELVFGTKLVLAFIIAWCQTPLFKGMNKRQGEWMFLATEHAVRELKMRTGSFKLYLDELQASGLLAASPASQGIITQEEFEQLKSDLTRLSNQTKPEQANFNLYFKPRSIQNKSVIYRLLVATELKRELPIFNPFVLNKEPDREGLGTTKRDDGKDQESLASRTKPGKIARKVLKVVPVENKTFEKTFPVNTCHDSNNYNYDKTKHDHAMSRELEISKTGKALANTKTATQKSKKSPEYLSQELSAEEQAKFDFLHKQATFAGYSHKDGQITLDSREALKFALNSALTLGQIKACYDQVNNLWCKGECHKNPLGLLHWMLRTIDKPKSNSDRSSRPNNSRKQQEARKRESWQSATRRTTSIEQRTSSTAISNSIKVDDKVAEITTVSKITTLPDPKWLWELIKQDDLVGRFRLSQSDLKLLEGSQLQLERNRERCQVVLVLHSALEERQLGHITRNIIELALRQRLGSGFKLIFEVANNCP